MTIRGRGAWAIAAGVGILAFYLARVALPAARSNYNGFASYYTAAHLLAYSPSEIRRVYDDDWFIAQIPRAGIAGVSDIFNVQPPTMSLMLLPLAFLTAPAARFAWMVLVAAALMMGAPLPYMSPRFAEGWMALFAYPRVYGAYLLWAWLAWALCDRLHRRGRAPVGRVARPALAGPGSPHTSKETTRLPRLLCGGKSPGTWRRGVGSRRRGWRPSSPYVREGERAAEQAGRTERLSSPRCWSCRW